MRDFSLPGRSPIYAQEAAVATSHPLSTEAALAVLRDGGNAVDAAITAVAVQGVVEPHMTGIGGDCFALYAAAGSAEVIALNGSGRAPGAATIDAFRSRGVQAFTQGSPHCVTVPGSVAAWARLAEDHGTRDMAALLAPAIRYAEEGYPIYPRVALDWAGTVPLLKQNPGARQHLLVGEAAPAVRTIHRQPALAETLRRIGRDGAAGFYSGAVAQDIVGTLQGLGGLHTLDDFAQARADYVTPIKTTYRGYDILECPPNGQGLAALLLLNILGGWDLSDLDIAGAERTHLLAEATKAAYRIRDTRIGDPEAVDVPVETLLSAETAARLRALIEPDRAGPAERFDTAEHKDTVYICVVDRDGNAISFINSLFHGFGSGIVGPESGVVLHSRGCSFRLEDGHANAIAPGKRPMHTIIPGMVMQGGRAVMPFGVMGGHYQAAGQAHVLSAMLDGGLDVQAAIDAPRSFAIDGVLQVERTISAAVQEDLERRGHTLQLMESPLGGAQAIWIDQSSGLLIAGSDPRKDGCALGF